MMSSLVHRSPFLVGALLAFAGSMLSSCTDMHDFDTTSGESFCGSIVPGPFVRSGFAPGVSMRLHLHPESIDRPGDLSTSDDQLQTATLHSLPEVQHDALDTIEMGEGRIRNMLYAVQPARGSSGMAIVSLVDDGSVEVRIIRGVPSTGDTQNLTPPNGNYLFGLFLLNKQQGTCGF